MPLSVTVITFNESAKIEGALESVRWADEIVVVDSESTDDTVAIARRFTDRVIVRPWPGYADQKNFAAAEATHDWILSIDADERISAPLADELRQLVAVPPPLVGYQIPRVTFHLGRWIRSTDWYPNYQMRFYDRRHGRWVGKYVHESVKIDGDYGRLRGEILHYGYRDLSDHWQKIDRYSALAARDMYERGRRAGWVDLALHPPAAFLRNYVLRAGFRDGMAGLVVSAMNARYVGLKFAKLWELCSPSTSTRRAPGAEDNNKPS